jgi:ABC-type transport system involved in Fe-S cluster assembly fused permease/ATPase subunit
MFFLLRFKSCKFLTILKTLWPYLWGDDRKIRYKLTLSIMFNGFAVLGSIITPFLFGCIIDSLSSSQSSPLSHSWFFTLLIAYVGVWSISKIFLYLRKIMMFPVMERANHLLVFHLFQQIQFLPFQYHLKRKTGEVTGVIEMAMDAFQPIVWSFAFAFVPLVVESICVFGIITLTCGVCYSLILIACLIFYIGVTRWGFRRVLRFLRQANLSQLETTSKIVDSFLNFSSIKYFHTYDFEFKKIDRVLESRENKISGSLIRDQMIRVHQALILSLSFLLLMVFAGYNLILNRLSLGQFIMIHTYMLQFTSPLEGFGQIFQTLNQSFVKMEKALRVFKYRLETKHGFIKLDRKNPLHIVFEDVWFGYQKDMPILKGISFELLPNQTLAIIGETGSGKSTIISLLLGFAEPSKGRILINGHDLKSINQESLIALIGIVPQDVTLFNDTISHNILYADMSANNKMLNDILYITNLKKTIQKLPQGIETIVGERGSELSGGEKQRIGLARAIIRRPKLYIFDEATSSLDSKTERQIIKNIESISKSASTLIISHNLSTISFADKIIILEKGLIQDKSYDSLIKEGNTL